VVVHRPSSFCHWQMCWPQAGKPKGFMRRLKIALHVVEVTVDRGPTESHNLQYDKFLTVFQKSKIATFANPE
jgi:hypothetical protein